MEVVTRVFIIRGCRGVQLVSPATSNRETGSADRRDDYHRDDSAVSHQAAAVKAPDSMIKRDRVVHPPKKDTEEAMTLIALCALSPELSSEFRIRGIQKREADASKGKTFRCNAGLCGRVLN